MGERDNITACSQGYELTDRVSSYITVYYSDTIGDYPVVDRVVFGESEGISDAEDVAPQRITRIISSVR